MKFCKENSMINNNYTINSEPNTKNYYDKKEDRERKSAKQNPGLTGERYKKRENFKINQKNSVLAGQNLNFINDFLKAAQNSLDLNEFKDIQLEIYDDFFANYEIDDFGMNKQDISKPPHFLDSSFIKLVYHLIFSYFNDNEEKNFIYSNNNKVFDCIHCKVKQSDQEKIKSKFFSTKMNN